MPTLVANQFFLPKHLLHWKRTEVAFGRETGPSATPEEGD